MALRKPLDGFVYTPLHDRQREVKQHWAKTTMFMLTGPAGTGKTTAALGEALLDIISGKSRYVYLCKPNVEAGEKYGFFPGTPEDKYLPWMGAFEDVLSSVSHDTIETLKDIVKFVPIGLARGRTFKYGTMIVDEAQNLTYTQIKLLGSRVGSGGRIVFCGDESQTDLTPDKWYEGRVPLTVAVKNAEAIRETDEYKATIVAFKKCDQLRHPFVTAFLNAMK
jgi:phosphate starvation-inducible protein PhoH and related proteins